MACPGRPLSLGTTAGAVAGAAGAARAASRARVAYAPPAAGQHLVRGARREGTAESITDYTSSNWDGYFATAASHGTDFTAVSATWTQAEVTCSGSAEEYPTSSRKAERLHSAALRDGALTARSVGRDILAGNCPDRELMFE